MTDTPMSAQTAIEAADDCEQGLAGLLDSGELSATLREYARLKSPPADVREAVKRELKSYAHTVQNRAGPNDLDEHADRLTALLTPQWRGMESAPRDGTAILAYSDWGEAHIARWVEAHQDGGIECSEGWVSSSGIAGGDFYMTGVVGWMPLPDSEGNVQELHKTPEDGVGNTDTTPPADQREAVKAIVVEVADDWLNPDSDSTSLDDAVNRILAAVRGKA